MLQGLVQGKNDSCEIKDSTMELSPCIASRTLRQFRQRSGSLFGLFGFRTLDFLISLDEVAGESAELQITLESHRVIHLQYYL